MCSVISKLLLIPLAVLAIGCGGGDEKSVQGVMALFDPDNWAGSWNSCSGTGGYDDFGPGMNVTVRDGSGNIVGSGRTESFSSDDLPAEDALDYYMTELQGSASFAKNSGFTCAIKFDVPIESANFYEIEVGKRGGLSYSDSELEENGYWIELVLGD
jgi:hypothetical protein